MVNKALKFKLVRFCTNLVLTTAQVLRHFVVEVLFVLFFNSLLFSVCNHLPDWLSLSIYDCTFWGPYQLPLEFIVYLLL